MAASFIHTACIALALALAALPAKAWDVEMYVPEGREQTTSSSRFAPAIRADDFIFVSGVVGEIPADTERTPQAYADAIRKVFRDIEDILAAAGADWGDVVDMTTFHVDMRSHQQIFFTVRKEFITDEPYPAWTAIGVDKLWFDPMFVEMKVTAYVGE